MPKRTPPHSFEWLPFERWLIPNIFHFTYVKGIAKYFLIAEMVLAVLVVVGTFMLLFLKATGASSL